MRVSYINSARVALLIGHLDTQVHIIHERKKELASIKNYK